MIALVLIAIAATVYMGFNFTASKRRQSYVAYNERPALHRSAIQIICGNCSGESEFPFRTFMNLHGRCDTCGGNSYMLASHRGLFMRGLVEQAARASALAAQDGRVVPFEARPKIAMPSDERIAV